jgi:nucleoside-diphosphate-sugar epimerase
MKFVVIGGGGLIETKLVKRLRDAGHEIIAEQHHREGLFSRRCFVGPIGADQTTAGFCQGDA